MSQEGYPTQLLGTVPVLRVPTLTCVSWRGPGTRVRGT
jgi:hypothetical protein